MALRRGVGIATGQYQGRGQGENESSDSRNEPEPMECDNAVVDANVEDSESLTNHLPLLFFFDVESTGLGIYTDALQPRLSTFQHQQW